MYKKLTSLVLLLFASASLYSQHGLHLQFLKQQLPSQQYQPANLAYHDFDKFALSFDAASWVGTNAFTLDAIFNGNNYISSEAKDKMLDQMGDNNYFQQGTPLGYVGLNLKLKDRKYTAWFKREDQSVIHFANPNSAGLLLNGNKPYAGQTITDEGVYNKSAGWYEVGVGTAFEKDKLKVGVNLKALLGIYNSSINRFDYSFFTDELGTQITLNADYDIVRTQAAAGLKGFGAGLDIGVIYELNEKMSLQASVIDLGVINWDVLKYENEVSFDYTGFNIRDLFDNNLSSAGLFDADSINQILFPDSTEGTYLGALPAQASIGLQYQLNEKSRLNASLHGGFTRSAPTTPLPLLNVAYYRQFGKVLEIGANAYGGGVDRYGVGLMAAGDFTLAKVWHLRLFAGSDNILGLALPATARGFSLSGGITVAR